MELYVLQEDGKCKKISVCHNYQQWRFWSTEILNIEVTFLGVSGILVKPISFSFVMHFFITRYAKKGTYIIALTKGFFWWSSTRGRNALHIIFFPVCHSFDPTCSDIWIYASHILSHVSVSQETKPAI